MLSSPEAALTVLINDVFVIVPNGRYSLLSVDKCSVVLQVVDSVISVPLVPLLPTVLQFLSRLSVDFSSSCSASKPGSLPLQGLACFCFYSFTSPTDNLILHMASAGRLCCTDRLQHYTSTQPRRPLNGLG